MKNKAIVGKLPLIPNAGNVRLLTVDRHKRAASASQSDATSTNAKDKASFAFGASRGNQAVGDGYGRKVADAAAIRERRSS